jgi:hypothetical protein
VRIRRSALMLGAVLLTLLLPTTALAATGGSTASTAHTPAPSISLGNGIRVTLNSAKAVCHAVTSVPGVTKRCSLTQQLPLRDLPAAARAQRSKDMQKIPSRFLGPRTATPSAATTITEPTQCNFSSTEYAVTGVSNPDRFTSCDDRIWTAQNIEYLTAPPYFIVQGMFMWEDQQWTSYSATSGHWTHGMVTLGYADPYGGNLSGGVTGQMYSGCFLASGICSATSLTTPDPQAVSIAPGGIYSFEWDEADTGASATTPNTDNILDPYLGVTWEISNTAQPTTGVDVGYLAGRCDTMVITTTDGCVDEGFTPTVVYDATLNPLVEDVALHIDNAQNTLSTAWGVPTYIKSNGHVLNRDMNSADQTANNRVACASVVTIPGQTNCDEFPLATTYQGAAFQPVWSAVAVPVTANSSQGGITNAFYKGNRVIDDDAFYVLAILSNGSISW